MTAEQTGHGAHLPVYPPPPTTPLQTLLELRLLYLGKGLRETPGPNSGRCTCAPWEHPRKYTRNITRVTDLLSHLARDLVADGHDAAVGQLQHTDHLTGHHIQRHLGHHGDSSCWCVCQTVAHWKGRGNKDTAGFKVKSLKITDKEALPWERNGSVLDTSKQSTTVSPCDREIQFRSTSSCFNAFPSYFLEWTFNYGSHHASHHEETRVLIKQRHQGPENKGG